MTTLSRRNRIEQELKDLPIGKARVIAWETVVRWTESTWEIGTWGKKTSDFQTTVAKLMREETTHA